MPTVEQYDLSMERGLSVMYPELYEALSTIALNEVKLVEEADGYYIITLQSVSEQKYEEIEKVATKIVSILAQEKLNKQLEEITSNLKIDKKKSFYQMQIGD